MTSPAQTQTVTSVEDGGHRLDLPSSTHEKRCGAWIRYREEHRSFRTGDLLSHRDTDDQDAADEDDEDGRHAAPPAFSLITTYNHPLPATQTQNTAIVNNARGMRKLALLTGQLPIHALHLHSPSLIHALRSVVKYYPSQDLSGEIIISWPYPILVHHYDELASFRDQVAEKDISDLCDRERGACEHIELLLKFLDRNIMDKVREEQERTSRGVESWEFAWVSQKPGTTFLQSLVGTGKIEDNFYSFVCHSITGGTFTRPWTKWIVNNWHMEYNGHYLGRVKDDYQIPKFDGERKTRFQKIVDLEMQDLPINVINQLQYGKKYWNLLRKQCMHYSGKTREFPYNEVNGLVMADLKAYYKSKDGMRIILMDESDCRKTSSECRCRVCHTRLQQGVQDDGKSSLVYEDYNAIDPILEKGALTTHQLFLCPSEMRAFVFRTRLWEPLHMKGFSEPRFDEDQIDHLVMDPQRKRTLKALAKSFARVNKTNDLLDRPSWTADFVEGKGQGMIFLLHGRPGVGKTCTAECIAAFTKRPLMIITASDIGVDIDEVESNLTSYFERARSWDAVLLIDEADVFMERRSNADLTRNSLVASFLRALEYFDGILFLTTNRVGQFDDAFISRVHVQLYYPEFDDEQRQKIWKTFMDKLAKDRGDYFRLNIDAKDYIRGKEIQALKWNGREIRNAFQTAVSLAEYDCNKDEEGKIVITDEHLRAVVGLSKDFKSYLNGLHQGDEAKRAERHYERLDSYQ